MEVFIVYFSEFHYIHGPILLYQYPEDTIDTDEYNLLSDYIIPKPILWGKVFTMRRKNYYLMGMPIEILNEKYQRHAIEFNLGFFLRKKDISNEKAREMEIEIYAKILKKIGEKLTELELESEYIWNEDRKTQLKSVIQQLYEQLEFGFNCFIRFDDFNWFSWSFNYDQEEYFTEEKEIPLSKYKRLSKSGKLDVSERMINTGK